MLTRLKKKKKHDCTSCPTTITPQFLAGLRFFFLCFKLQSKLFVNTDSWISASFVFARVLKLHMQIVTQTAQDDNTEHIFTNDISDFNIKKKKFEKMKNKVLL